MTTAAGPVAVRCAMCGGHGCEPVLEAGRLRLKRCWWCGGTGEVGADRPPPPCPCCGDPMMSAAADWYCPTCTRWGGGGDDEFIG